MAPANRISNKMVALCAGAIGIVYAAGYMVTSGAAAAEAAGTDLTMAPSSVSSQPQVSGQQSGDRHFHDREGGRSHDGDHGSAGPSTRQTAPPTTNSAPATTNTAPSQKAAATAYRDGTFTGRSSNRYGSLGVTVTIAKGQIKDVQVINYDMHYPESYIRNLPQVALAAQSSQVDIVSGATFSSMNFRNAMQQALLLAQAKG